MKEKCVRFQMGNSFGNARAQRKNTYVFVSIGQFVWRRIRLERFQGPPAIVWPQLFSGA